MISAGNVSAFLCVVIAFLYYKYNLSSSSQSNTANIINAWDKKLQNTEPGFRKLFIGINACTDLIVKGTEVFKALNVKPSAQADHPELNSLVDLQDGFHYHFKRGTAAERPFTHAEEFKRLVKVASSLEKSSWFVGGNAALIAHNIAEMFPDVEVHLLGPVGPKLRDLLHPRVLVPEQSIMDTDEVHLIMEFKVGENWGSSVAPIATRYITSHDVSNSHVKPLESFFTSVKESKPDLIVFSGLHMLEGQAEDIWRDRMHSLDMHLQQLPRDIPIHMELASMTDEGLLEVVADKTLVHISALGLNEQELVFLNRVMRGPNWEKMSHQPYVSQVTEALAWILDSYGPAKQSTSRLTRVHFHSLQFHVLATIPGYWQNTDIAVAAGTKTGALKACDSKDLNPEKLELKLNQKLAFFPGDKEHELDVDSPVVSYTYKGYKFDFSPVLVCRKPLKTVGLGDAISATGLIYSKYSVNR